MACFSAQGSRGSRLRLGEPRLVQIGVGAPGVAGRALGAKRPELRRFGRRVSIFGEDACAHETAKGYLMAKTKPRGCPEPSTSYYILQITDWDWSYHFGVNAVRHDDRRYFDRRHLLVLRPSKLRQKAEPV